MARIVDVDAETVTCTAPLAQLEEAARAAGSIRLCADLMSVTTVENEKLRAGIASTAANLQRILRAVAGGALVVALAVAGLTVNPGRALAAEGPEPDPVRVVAPAVVAVAFTGGVVRVPVRTVHVTPQGLYCASAWGAAGFLGRACSYAPSFTVPATLSRWTPLGRTVVTVTDDVAPMDVAPARVVLDIRRPSKFGLGQWVDLGQGQIAVAAPLYAYTASTGAWTPQRYSPVQVQERVGGRWVVRATLVTSSAGVAAGVVNLGGGIHVARVARQSGATVWSTVGTTRTVVITTEPLDID